MLLYFRASYANVPFDERQSFELRREGAKLSLRSTPMAACNGIQCFWRVDGIVKTNAVSSEGMRQPVTEKRFCTEIRGLRTICRHHVGVVLCAERA